MQKMKLTYPLKRYEQCINYCEHCPNFEWITKRPFHLREKLDIPIGYCKQTGEIVHSKIRILDDCPLEGMKVVQGDIVWE